MATNKVRIQPLLDADTHAALEKEAIDHGAKISPYAAAVLKKYVSKKEIDKPFTPKKEYGE